MFAIDGTYLIYKSYYRGQKMRASREEMTEDVFYKTVRNIFLKHLARLKNEHKISEWFIAFDGEEKTFRQDLFPSYKSNRKEKPKDILQVKQEIYRFLEDHGFPFQVSDGVEGDDLIASVIAKYPDKKMTIFSGDQDFAALVSEKVNFLLDKQQKVQVITLQNFHHHFAAPPHLLNDFKALQGDKRDSIKGVSGLFASQVTHILMEFGNIETFYEKGTNHQLYAKLSHEKEKVLLNKHILRTKQDVVIEVDERQMNVANLSMPESIGKRINW